MCRVLLSKSYNWNSSWKCCCHSIKFWTFVSFRLSKKKIRIYVWKFHYFFQKQPNSHQWRNSIAYWCCKLWGRLPHSKFIKSLKKQIMYLYIISRKNHSDHQDYIFCILRPLVGLAQNFKFLEINKVTQWVDKSENFWDPLTSS